MRAKFLDRMLVITLLFSLFSVLPVSAETLFRDDFDTLSFEGSSNGDENWVGRWVRWNVNVLEGNNDRYFKTWDAAAYNGGPSVEHVLRQQGWGDGPFLHETKGGVLALRAFPAPTDLQDAIWGYPYVASMISTEQSFAMNEGYIEIRYRNKNLGKGTHVAAWLLDVNGEWPPEIDLFETLSEDKNGSKNFFAYNAHGAPSGPTETAGQLHGDQNFEFLSEQAFKNWHTFRFEWTSEELVWKRNGNVVRRQENYLGDRQMYFLVTLEGASDWPGDPDATTIWPQEVEIDYVEMGNGASPAPGPAPDPAPAAPTGLVVDDVCVEAACGGERVVRVDGVNGDDTNTGLSDGAPVKTLTKAAEILRGGDVLIVHPGTYYEKPVFSNIGSSMDKPVWIRSATPGKATISGLWQAADQGYLAWQSEGNGVYSAVHGDVYSGSYQDVYLFRYKSKSDLEAESVQGIRKPSYGIAHEQNNVYIRLPGNENPNGKSIQITDRFAQELVTLNNSPYVIFDGFNIEGSGNRHAMAVDRDSHHVTLRNLNITHCRHAARLPDDAIVEWSEYFYPNFRGFVDDLIDLNGSGSNGAIYPLVKEYYSQNGNAYLEGGLAISSSTPSSNNEFRYNYIHEVFDGERLGEFNNSRTHHNVYDYNYDDHIQFESWRSEHPTQNIHAHDNLFLNSASTMLSHQDTSGGMQGPHYVYRNVLHVNDDQHGQPWTAIKSYQVTNSNIYYYHNLFNFGRTQLYWQNSEKLTFINNIFLFDDLRNVDGQPDAHHNLLVNNRELPAMTGGGGQYLGNSKSTVRIKDLVGLDFTLLEDSPAIDQGVKIDDWTDSHGVSNAPDMGPFELGETPGPNWPRPRQTIYTTSKPERWTY